MQDAEIDLWAHDEQVPTELLRSMRGLNLRFLELMAATSLSDGWDWVQQGTRAVVLDHIAALSSTQKLAVADCPYALFDLRFHDEAHWHARLHTPAGCVAEAAMVNPEAVEFARLAIFFAWHAAHATRFAATLLLGMRPQTVSDFHRADLDRLPGLIAAEAVNLTARWSDCPAYWAALTAAAAESRPARLKRIQLYGLQLATAARLA